MKKLILSLLLLLSCSPLWAVNHTRIVRSCPNGTTCAYASGLNGYVLVGNGVDFDYQLFASVPAGLSIGVSAITGGTDTRVLFDDAGFVGENSAFTFVKGTGTLHSTHMTATDFTGALIGNSSTSTAFDHNPANCSAGNYPLGIDSTGAVESCTAVASGLTVGTTTIASGTNTRVLFDDSAVLGESAGLTYVKGTGTLSATAFSGPLTGNVTGNVTGALTGNASTATALAANGTNCSAASFPLGVDAGGNSESCTALSASNAGTATALAANGTNCSSGSFPLGVDASGNSESCTTVSSVVPDLSALAFVTVGNTASLSAERAITAGNNVALTDGGANSTETIAEGTAAVAFTNAITPTQIAANTNDYNPTGLSTAYTLRLSTDASRNLTGISASGAGAVEGRQLVIENVGTNDLVLKDKVTSSAANQFSNGGKDFILKGGNSAQMQYDNTAQFWRVFTPKVKITGTGGEASECADDQIQSVSDGTNNQCVTLGASSVSGQTATSGSLEFGVQKYKKANNTFAQVEIREDPVFGATMESCLQLDNSGTIFATASDSTGWTCQSTGTTAVRTEQNPLAGTNYHYIGCQTKTSPASGDTCGWAPTAGNQHKAIYNPRYETRIRTDSAITSTRIYEGMSTAALTFTPSTSAFTGPNTLVAVVFASDVSSNTWLFCSAESNAANKAQCFDTTITAAVDTDYFISIYTPDRGVTWIANINGTEYANTTHVPTTTQAMSVVTSSVMTLTSAQKLFYYGPQLVREYH
jgi:hypothetical protein